MEENVFATPDTPNRQHVKDINPASCGSVQDIFSILLLFPSCIRLPKFFHSSVSIACQIFTSVCCMLLAKVKKNIFLYLSIIGCHLYLWLMSISCIKENFMISLATDMTALVTILQGYIFWPARKFPPPL